MLAQTVLLIECAHSSDACEIAMSLAPETLSRLQTIVGDSRVRTDADSLKTWGCDWTKMYTPAPTAIVFPSSIEQVQAVVLLAKALSPALEMAVASMGAPKTVVGIIIALVVLLPESIAAYHAARANRLQTSLNLALGSALASIGLTIPAVALVSLMTGWTLSLGIDAKSTVLLVLSLFVASLSLGTGRTTVMQGTVHLVIFAVYLFTAIVP